jgi:hypothetical protein
MVVAVCCKSIAARKYDKIGVYQERSDVLAFSLVRDPLMSAGGVGKKDLILGVGAT